MRSSAGMRAGFVLGLCVALCGCTAGGENREAIYQVSTLNALLAGLYEGQVPVGELTAHGDLGIGTFDAVDGEMAVVDGVVYQMTSDGVARHADDAVRTPFACVTFFDADGSAPVPPGTDMAAFCALLDKLAGAPNLPLAIRVRGRFARTKTRNVPRQTPPYRRLAEVVKEQPVYDLSDVEGVIVGFRLPKYLDGVNMSGYHLHFVTADRTAGGHLLDFEVADATVEWDVTPRLTLVLPETGAFPDADLTPQAPDEVARVER
jgi:acetolactate decarboxylase